MILKILEIKIFFCGIRANQKNIYYPIYNKSRLFQKNEGRV